MISIEDIKAAHEKMQEAAQPMFREFEVAKKKFDDACKNLQMAFQKECEKFYDQELKDTFGRSPQRGDVITNGKVEYKVTDRGMPFILGTVLNSPRVMVVRQPDGKKVKHISKRELLEYRII